MTTVTIEEMKLALLREEIVPRLEKAVANLDKLAACAKDKGQIVLEARLSNKAKGFQKVIDDQGERLTFARNERDALVITEFIRITAENETNEATKSGMLMGRDYVFGYLR